MTRSGGEPSRRSLRIVQIILAIPVLQLLIGGWTYAVRARIMPHHEAALGIAWDTLSADAQLLLLSFMRVIGLAHVALGLAALVALVWIIPRWPKPASLVTASLLASFYVGALLIVVQVGRATEADPPIAGLILALVCAILAGLTALSLKMPNGHSAIAKT